MLIGSQIGLNKLIWRICGSVSSRSKSIEFTFVYLHLCNNSEKKATFIQLRVDAKGAKFSSSQAREPNVSGQRGLHP